MSQSKAAPRWANRLIIVLCVALTPVILTAATLIAFSNHAAASSHREAPLIGKDAYADATDTWAFMAPGSTENVVLIGSWIPFEGPEGGPNYFEWDPNALYDIYVDTDGNASPDVTYTLSSEVQTVDPNTFLYNKNAITSLDDPDWNLVQTITVVEQKDGAAPVTLVDNKRTAPVNIGDKSTPDYTDLEDEAIYTTDGVKVYAGQTDDAFWVDLQVFDLLTLRGQEQPIGYDPSKGNNIPVDSLSGFNVHSLVIEVPVARIKENNNAILGVWTGTRRPAQRVLLGAGGLGAQTNTGEFIQVSRLGLPLVNEVVVPLALKDAFNSLPPSADAGLYTGGTPAGELLHKSVEDPELGTLLCALYAVPMPGDDNDDCHTEVDPGGAGARSGRGDIFDIFLTGMVLANPFTITTAGGPVGLPAGFNVNRPAGVQPAEMIRINTAISGTLCAPEPNYKLGLLGGDACGFPNGRRLRDEVVEIELLAVAGAGYEVLDDRDASFHFNPALIGVLTDGVTGNDVGFRSTFPYLAQAQSGQDHIHTNPFLGLFVPFVSNVAVIFGGAPGVKPVVGWSSLAFVALVLPAMIFMRRRKQ